MIFLGIGDATWYRYKKEKGYEEYWSIIAQVEKIIYTQKLTGAAANLLNANIIARDLGLKDEQKVDATVTQVKIIRE